jgi:hypothetical protein
VTLNVAASATPTDSATAIAGIKLSFIFRILCSSKLRGWLIAMLILSGWGAEMLGSSNPASPSQGRRYDVLT